MSHPLWVVINDRYPQVATEILTSDLWTIAETIMTHKDRLLRPFWEAVLPQNTPDMSRQEQGERERARDEFWSEEDEERHRQRETIRGFWTRINAFLLLKRPQEVGTSPRYKLTTDDRISKNCTQRGRAHGTAY